MIYYFVKVPNKDDFKTVIGLEYGGTEFHGILIYDRDKLLDKLDDTAVIIKEPHPIYPHESNLEVKTVGDMRRILKEQRKRLKQYEYGSKIQRKNKKDV